jgi:hypothetical protein
MQVAATTMNDSDRSDGAGTEFAARDNAWPLANLLWRIYAEVRPVSTSPGGLPSPLLARLVSASSLPAKAFLTGLFSEKASYAGYRATEDPLHDPPA